MDLPTATLPAPAPPPPAGHAQPAPPRRPRVVGEGLVWLTAMGLAIGLVMVIGMLAVIISHGLPVFWPKRVVELTLRPAAGAAPGATRTIGGEIGRSRSRLAYAEPGAAPIQEVQIYTGNREVYGITFRYVDVGDIVARQEPPDILRIERTTDGNAFGYPVALTIAGADPAVRPAPATPIVIPAADPAFAGRLDAALAAVVQRRMAIAQLEDGPIGANARAIAALRTHLAYLASAPSGLPADQQRALTAQLADLQTRYEVLASQDRELRARQQAATLTIRLMSGETRAIPVATIIRISQPNRASLLERLGTMAANLWRFVSEDPRNANTEGGIFPAIFGTFVMTLLMSVAVTPFGVIAAIYLREYARQGVVVRAVRIAINNLAGVPSIVFGVFGLGFFVYIVGGSIDRAFFPERLPTPTFGTGGILWASLTMALMTVPVVIVATEEAVVAVTRGAREASLACGASKWQTIRHIVLPAAVPGILTGLILAMARGAGEVAPLMMVGVVKLAPSLPIDGIFPFLHLDRKFMHLGFHIFDLGFQSPDSEAAEPMVFATTFFLIGLILALNLAAIVLRERLRRRYATAAF